MPSTSAGGRTTEAARDQHTCNAAFVRAFGFLGKRWNGVLLGALASGPAGFAELKRGIAGISDSMLSERLSELGQTGLIEREVEPGPPVAVTYRLTVSGEALLPALNAIGAWAEENLPAACPPGG